MTLSPDRTLSVFPNPYRRVDAYGNPSGVVPVESEEGGFSSSSHPGFIGAEVDKEKSQTLDTFQKGDLRSPREVTVFRFETTEPAIVPLSTYYMERIREGALLAADERTARTAGVKFEDPQKVLAASRAQAAETWKQKTGTELPSQDAAQGAAADAAPADAALQTAAEPVAQEPAQQQQQALQPAFATSTASTPTEGAASVPAPAPSVRSAFVATTNEEHDQ